MPHADQLTYELGPPAGFPQCARCPYAINGPVQVCVRCASAVVQPVAQSRCPVCSQAVEPGGTCRNRLCRLPRAIHRISAVATFSGALAETIRQFKYHDKHGWAFIFGRLVTGHLDATSSPDDVDLIVPNPTWSPTGQGGHTELVLRHAAREDIYGRWPFFPDHVLVKTASTARSAGMTAADKAAAAESLRSVLAQLQ